LAHLHQRQQSSSQLRSPCMQHPRGPFPSRMFFVHLFE
jgi:hypothetical protein